MKLYPYALVGSLALLACDSSSSPPKVDFNNSRPIAVIIDGVRLQVIACTESSDVIAMAQEGINEYEQSKWLKLGYSKVVEVCLTQPTKNKESTIVLRNTGIYFTVKGSKNPDYNEMQLAPQSI